MVNLSMWFKLLIIGCGGFLGAIARYLMGGWVHARLGPAFPYGTLFINILGSFLLGLFMVLSLRLLWNEEWRLFTALGFLGAFTTFSTFSYETIQLIAEGRRYGAAAVNSAGSVLLGLAGCYLGIALARAILAIRT